MGEKTPLRSIYSGRIVNSDKFTMPNHENEVAKLEGQFPATSGSAFATARQKVLASGQSVLLSEDGVLYEVLPDGTRKFVKQLESPTPIVPGRTYTIK